MTSDQPIIIAGAGIGGLSLALALQRAGFRVIVAERAPQLGEIGAGLTVPPNATRAFEYLGLGDILAERAAASGSSLTGLHYRTGEVLYRQLVTAGFKEKYGAELYLSHRADLHDMLTSAVLANDPESIRTGHDLCDIDQSDDRIMAVFTNGQSLSGTALIGCDGLRSTVRGLLFSRETPRFTGLVAFRGLAPLETVKDHLSPTLAASYFGPGRTFVRYPIRHGTTVNYVGIARTDAWQDEGWTTPATAEETIAQFEGWHPDVHALIRATPAGKLTKWALFDREPVELWTKGRATLLGDAAHPMLPFLGLGAAMAIEDAVVLSRCITVAADLPEAFARYEKARMERTKSVLLNSRRQGEIVQASHPEKLQASDGQGEIRLGLFEYDPVTVPV